MQDVRIDGPPMNPIELFELMTVHGFYRFLGQQARLPAEEVRKIYLLGRPWGVWPPDIDISREAAAAGIDVFTYLAALQPLIAMDTLEKENELVVYERTLSGNGGAESPSATRNHVEKVATLSTEKKQTICNVLHALYDYRQQVGALSIQKITEKAAVIAKLQRGILAESNRRRNENGSSTHNSTPKSPDL
jgi:hypothetical protein